MRTRALELRPFAHIIIWLPAAAIVGSNRFERRGDEASNQEGFFQVQGRNGGEYLAVELLFTNLRYADGWPAGGWQGPQAGCAAREGLQGGKSSFF